MSVSYSRQSLDPSVAMGYSKGSERYPDSDDHTEARRDQSRKLRFLAPGGRRRRAGPSATRAADRVAPASGLWPRLLVADALRRHRGRLPRLGDVQLRLR